MKRRHMLKQVLIGGSLLTFSGCSAPKQESNPTEPNGAPTEPNATPTEDEPQTPTETQPSDAEYVINSIHTNTDCPLEYSAEIIAGGYSNPNEPLQIKITISNPTEKTYSYRDSRQAFFEGKSSERTEFTLYPFVKDDSFKNYSFNGCWSRKNFFGMDSNLLMDKLEPGESTNRTVVLATPPNATCPNPPFEIRFTTSIEYSEHGFYGHQSSLGTEVQFTLLQKPEIK